MAKQEFEAWLIADHEALNGVLGLALPQSPSPEEMKPREAKELLATALAARVAKDGGGSDREVRGSIARTTSLDVVAKRCPAFDAFCQALGGTRG